MTDKVMHDYKCKNCDTIWHTRLSFDNGVAFCPTCKAGLSIRGRNNNPPKVPVVVQPELQKQSDIHKRFQDII